MPEKNDIIIAKTDALGSNGEGIVRNNGMTFFVPYCLPGEKVQFKVLKIKGKIGYGKVEEILTPAEERTREKCPVFKHCGGCQLQHLVYREQLHFKSYLVQENLRKISGIQIDVSPTIKSTSQYGYRNKLQLPIGVDKEGKNVIGFYAERSHRIIPVDSCAIHPKWSESIISIIKRYMSECNVKGYDEVNHTGQLRHIVVREIDNKYIITLVSVTEDLPNIKYLVDLIQNDFSIFTFYININDKDNNIIFGDKWKLVSGEGFFEGVEQDISYKAGPVTFIQVNSDIRRKLYDAAVGAVVKDGDEVVIDAYSGGGLLTAMVGRKCKRVYGIEAEEEAVKCADQLKENNNLTNMTNICGYVEDKIDDIIEKEKDNKLRLIVDPPRAGIARSVIKALLSSNIPKIVMISCNPSTMARDVGLLTGSLIEKDGELVKNPDFTFNEEDKTNNWLDGYYKLNSVQPYDMFPQTKHVETLIVLQKVNL